MLVEGAMWDTSPDPAASPKHRPDSSEEAQLCQDGVELLQLVQLSILLWISTHLMCLEELGLFQGQPHFLQPPEVACLEEKRGPVS